MNDRVAAPSSLYIIPVDDATEGEVLDVISTAGWEVAPRIGSWAVLVPVDRTANARVIDHVHTITRVSETGDREWPWELDLNCHEVPTPQSWFAITNSVLEEGLVPILGTSGDGVRLTDASTIALVWSMLGLSSQS